MKIRGVGKVGLYPRLDEGFLEGFYVNGLIGECGRVVDNGVVKLETWRCWEDWVWS